MSLWPEVDMLPIIPPSWTVPQKGKRQKNRPKGLKEEMTVQSQGNTYLRKKGRLKMTCSICGLRGHNKQYHSKPESPVTDWFEGDLEPVETQMNISTDRGKLVVAKRKEQLHHKPPWKNNQSSSPKLK